MIADLFAKVGEIVTGAATVIADLFPAVVEIFYDSSVEGTGLTIIGTLALIGVGFGLVMWAFNFILKLIKFR